MGIDNLKKGFTAGSKSNAPAGTAVEQGGTGGVVVSRFSPRLINRFPPLTWIIAVVLVLVIVVGLAVYLVWLRGNGATDTSGSTHTTAQTDDERFYTAIQASEVDAKNHQADQAAQDLQDYIDHSTNESHIETAYNTIGNVYENANENDKALAVYRKAEARFKAPKLSITLGIARTSFSMGDKQTAIKYYQQAIQLAEKSNNHTTKLDIPEFQNWIKTIEASK